MSFRRKLRDGFICVVLVILTSVLFMSFQYLVISPPPTRENQEQLIMVDGLNHESWFQLLRDELKEYDDDHLWHWPIE